MLFVEIALFVWNVGVLVGVEDYLQVGSGCNEREFGVAFTASIDEADLTFLGSSLAASSVADLGKVDVLVFNFF